VKSSPLGSFSSEASLVSAAEDVLEDLASSSQDSTRATVLLERSFLLIDLVQSLVEDLEHLRVQP
jgi:hypothetical protein